MDVHSKAVRSKNMRAIKSKNTKPELFVRQLLHSLGFRFRLHARKLPGTPDIVLKKYNAVIFVHGCFWHGHDCHLFVLPKTRTEFWSKKINDNKRRDKLACEKLISNGWRVLYIWECALKGRKKLDTPRLLATIEEWLIAEERSAELTHLGIHMMASSK
ncbi:MAG: DNA mismatch endonuclease (patch repair protein) [Cocleimonas sp.]|jgi:DNA mismatch endonuclease (patch repair protein)